MPTECIVKLQGLLDEFIDLKGAWANNTLSFDY